MVHALAALSTLLRIVVSDDACEVALCAGSVDLHAQAPDMSDASRLLAAICDQRDDAPEKSPPVDAVAATASNDSLFRGRMRVERSATWLRATATQLGRMLPALFGMLRRHPRGSVRVASVLAAEEVLLHCARTLPTCSTACLESLLCLAHDPWPQVAEAACACLRRHSSSTTGGSNAKSPRDVILWPKLEDMLVAQSAAFEAACKRGETDATVAARLLAGAIGVAGPFRAVNALAGASRRSQLCRRLTSAFALSGHAIQPAVTSFVASEALQLLATKDAALLHSGMALPRRHVRSSLLTSEEVRELQHRPSASSRNTRHSR